MMFKNMDNQKMNPFKHDHVFRNLAFIGAFISILLWYKMGFDSGIGEYGKSIHWSFFSIYGIEYILLTDHLRKKGITGTQNTLTSLTWMGFSVALFEWYWMISYSVFYGERWILYNNWLIYPNLIMTLFGVLVIFSLRKRIVWKNWALALATITLVSTLWWCPPRFVSSRIFPQTCYPQLSGFVVYIQNDVIHALNTLTKFGYSIGTVLMLRVKERAHSLNNG